MEYNTVYNIGDEVWFMHENRACVGKINQVYYSKYVSPVDGNVSVTEKYHVGNISELLDEERFFESKEDLLASL